MCSINSFSILLRKISNAVLNIEVFAKKTDGETTLCLILFVHAPIICQLQGLCVSNRFVASYCSFVQENLEGLCTVFQVFLKNLEII